MTSTGQLTGVAFEQRGQAAGRHAAGVPQGRPPPAAAAGRRVVRPGVRHRSTTTSPDLETYLGPLVVGGISRVLNRPAHIIGRSTQILPNNWKLYFENVKDTYHASILHSFLTTFRINRLSHAGQHQHRRERRPSFQPGQARLRRRGRRLQGGGSCAPTPTSSSRTIRSSSRSTNTATRFRCRS